MVRISEEEEYDYYEEEYFLVSEDDIYSENIADSMVDDDEMTAEDAGFMDGYNMAS